MMGNGYSTPTLTLSPTVGGKIGSFIVLDSYDEDGVLEAVFWAPFFPEFYSLDILQYSPIPATVLPSQDCFGLLIPLFDYFE